ncbi:hypothetical protein, partial [Collimonas silvisoli]|uniref:hypothetical protein n=1 Tax=Collimonas silvisoli TaxID=2825884 RepID=UPI001B8AB5C8
KFTSRRYPIFCFPSEPDCIAASSCGRHGTECRKQAIVRSIIEVKSRQWSNAPLHVGDQLMRCDLGRNQILREEK